MIPELFEPGEYLDHRGPGYFSILAKPKNVARQDSYELKHLVTVIEGLDPRHDTWISQATFNAPNRRAVNLQSVGLLFADLDTYNSPGLKGRPPEEQANMLVQYCAYNGIPAPSVIMFSGRGLQAKWLLSEGLSPANLTEWNTVQLGLVKALDDFGSDRNARDISRVLRLDRTVNTKSGEQCRVVYVNSGVEKVPTRYAFEDMLELFPAPKPERKPFSDKPRNIVTLPDSMSLRRLNWYRLYDIRDLWKMRGGVPEGYRETTLFWELNFLLRAEPVRVQDMWKEAQALASEIDDAPGWYKNSDLGTLYKKAQATAKGESIEYRGKAYPALYTPRNTTLAEIFRITPDEERMLRTIISRDEKERRRREKRWANGTTPQPYRHNKPWEALGISRRTYYRRYADKSSAKVCHEGEHDGQRDMVRRDRGVAL